MRLSARQAMPVSRSHGDRRCGLKGPRLVIGEVNFDLLIEDVRGSGPAVPSHRNEEFADCPGRSWLSTSAALTRSHLYSKWHGSIGPARDLRGSSAEQTERGISTTKLGGPCEALLDDDSPRLWIYVGASMRDKDLLRTFQDADFRNAATDEAVGVAPFVVSHR